jgi:hypothetical protein
MAEKMFRTIRINANIFFEVPVSYEPTGKEQLFLGNQPIQVGIISEVGNRIAARPLDKETIEVVEVDNDEVIR